MILHYDMNMKLNEANKTIPMYSNTFWHQYAEKTLEIIKNFEDIEKPSSLYIESMQELERHKDIFEHMVSEHIQLAVKNWMESQRWDQFPNNCCWYSNANIIRALYHKWYSQALRARSWTYDHSYILVPFVTKNWEKWVFIIDPTYQQVYKENSEHTWVLIKNDIQREYITDRKDWANLYPESLSSLNQFKRMDWIVTASIDINQEKVITYLEQAHKNPKNQE